MERPVTLIVLHLNIPKSIGASALSSKIEWPVYRPDCKSIAMQDTDTLPY